MSDRDPRPDRSTDSPLWGRLLTSAYSLDGQDATGLYGALHALRCVGGTLVERQDGALTLRPPADAQAGEVTADEYASFRSRWLAPHSIALTKLLTEGINAA